MIINKNDDDGEIRQKKNKKLPRESVERDWNVNVAVLTLKEAKGFAVA